VYRRVERKPVSEAVFEQLREAILAGRLAAGTPLDSERALSEEFGVNRHAIREAMKRLQQAGLVHVAQGGSTRVLDWRASGGLDLLAHLPVGPGRPPAGVLRAIVELRQCVGADAARRCAERAPAAIAGRLRDAVAGDDLPADPAEQHVRYAALWELVIDGADNIAYRLAYNSLLAGLDPRAALSLELFADEARDAGAQRALVEAIAAQDPDAAAAAAEELLCRAGRAALSG
jgi:DNA-binding FadR family transcriptional regulator